MTRDFSCIGISCGGPLDSRRGVILSPPNLPGWDEVEIVAYLKERYGGRVSLQNDANACAVAEWKYGAGRGTENMLFLTFGTGLGAGLILGGRVYSGANGMAGEVGHIRIATDGPLGYGKQGSFEGFCSGGGLALWAKDIARDAISRGERIFGCSSYEKVELLSAAHLASLARDGDIDAIELFRRCGERLGEGLAMLVDILNPERIVIGSIYQRCEELLRDGMESALKREALPEALRVCSIVPAALTESIGDIAALAVAKV